jgi:hypothetical protein
MDRAVTLEELARLCQNHRDASIPPVITATGCTELDNVLPNGGWQSGTIVELMATALGIGELRLLMPALASMTREGRYLALIAPPYIPFAPAFVQQGIQLERLLIIQAQTSVDALWACEQTLRCGSFGAALAWPSMLKDRDIRRLQLAAEAGRSTGFLYRAPAAALEASPAAMRLMLQAEADGALRIDLLKCRGIRSGVSVRVTSGVAARSAPQPKPPPSVPRAYACDTQLRVDDDVLEQPAACGQ